MNKCQICYKKLSLIIHTGEKTIICDLCEKAFPQGDSSTRRMKINAAKPFKCDFCEKSFKEKCELIQHARIHTGENPFECYICEKAFSQLGHLNVHMRFHAGEKRYPCDICDKAFIQKGDLIVHKRIHTGEKPYSCDTCDKAFKQQNELIVHRRIHTGERPYICNTCKKAYRTGSDLTNHMRTHTGEKPYSCEVCQKSYNQISNLRTHKKSAIHIKKLKSFKKTVSPSASFVTCDEADENLETEEKEILDKDPLSMQADTSDFVDEKPFACEVCDKSFKSKDVLNIHRYMHPEQKSSNQIKAEKNGGETLDEEPISIKMEAESVEVIIKEEIRDEEEIESEEYL